MTLGQTIKNLRKEHGLSREELSQKIGVTYWTVAKYETDKRSPDYETTKKIADVFNVSVDYLLNRTSSRKTAGMGEEDQVEPVEIDLLDALEDNDINITAGDQPITREQRVSILRALVNPGVQPQKANKIPILGTIRAGLPLLAESQWIGEVEISPSLKADFALKVIGDSMSWAGIHEGDIAILRKTEVAQHGMIVAAGVEEEEWTATLKYYVVENGQHLLRAGNPAYEDVIIGPEHRIIGHVVKIHKDPLPLHMYKNILLSGEIFSDTWEEAIETASQYGMSGQQVKKLIELFSHMVKQI